MKLTLLVTLIFSQFFYSNFAVSASLEEEEPGSCCFFLEQILSKGGFGPDAYNCLCYGPSKTLYAKQVQKRKDNAIAFCCCGAPLLLAGVGTSYMTTGEQNPYVFYPENFSEPFIPQCMHDEMENSHQQNQQISIYCATIVKKITEHHVQHSCAERSMTNDQVITLLGLSAVEQVGREGAQALAVLGGCGIVLSTAHLAGYVWGLMNIGAQKVKKAINPQLPTEQKEKVN